MTEEPSGVLNFKNGYLRIDGEKLIVKDHPDTGMPTTNFKIEFDFKTT
jgi:hypothetical protein